MQIRTLDEILAALRAASPPRRLLFSRIESDAEAETPAAAAAFKGRPNDSHFHRELHLVLSSSRLFRVGGRSFLVRPGEAVFVDRWEEHCSVAPPGVTDAPFVTAVLHGHQPMWWHTICEQGFNNFRLIVPETYVNLSPELSAFFERHLDAALVDTAMPETAIRLATTVNAAIAEYVLAIGRAAQAGERQALPLEAVRRRIAESNGAHCTVAGLAALAGLDPKTLDRRFRAAFGRSVRDEIQRVREAYVRFAVVCGETQKAIATALGFSAVSNYNRWRRQHDRRANRLEDIVRTYIDHNHGANCSLGELASRFGYSVSRLVHIYKERTGESIGDRVRQARLDYLQAHPELPLQTLAKNLGFLSEASCRAWRRREMKQKPPTGKRRAPRS